MMSSVTIVCRLLLQLGEKGRKGETMFKILLKMFNNDEKRARRALYMLVILLESHGKEVYGWDDGDDKEIYSILLDAIREEHKG